jgi:alpha-tubulin suppressor-like RCC1 family protein
MKIQPSSLRPLATFAAALVVLVACQLSTSPTTNSDDPVDATADFPVNASRIPDSTVWKIHDTTASQVIHCTGTTSVTCTETFHLPHPLGDDSLSLELWTLGIRTSTIYFGQKGRSTTLDLKSTILRDALETLLLSKYSGITSGKKDSLSKLGKGASALVAYYASLILSGDTAFVGKPLPVGMSADSIKKDLVYLAKASGLTVSELLAKNFGKVTLDSATVVVEIKILIKAGALNSSDSAAIFPPYPVRVKTPISVNGAVAAGGSPVFVNGLFAWTKGQNIKAPSIQVRTSKPGDSAYFTFPTRQFTSTDTGWNLDGNLALQAATAAPAGTDTLVVTISDDAGHSATSRTAFQVTGAKDTLGPTLRWTTPATSIGVDASVSTYKVQVSASDPSGVDSVYIQGASATHDTGSIWYSTVTLGAANGKPQTLVAKAWDKGKVSSLDSSISITRNVPSGTDKPVLTILQPASNVNNTLVYDSATLHLVYKITDLVPLDTASIKFGTITPKKLTDSTWSADVPVPPTGQPVTIVVQAANKNGSGSSENVVVTRAKDAVPPTIAKGAGAKSRTVPFDTSTASISWTVSDNSKVASIALNGGTLNVTSTVTQSVNLAVGVDTFVLAATDTFGNTQRDTVVITRSADSQGPSIRWVSPSTSTSVDAAVTTYKVQVAATDLSGVDSVYLQGSMAVHDSGAYWSATVQLGQPNGAPLKVVAKAWDKKKNLAQDSSISITRNVPSGTDKPTLTILQPSSNINNMLVFDSATLHVVYKITDLVPLDTESIKFGTTTPKKLTDSTWAADVPVPATGAPISIVVVAANKNGNGNSENVVVTRAKDLVPPSVTLKTGPKSQSVPFATTSIHLSWGVKDNYKMGSITLNGGLVALDTTVSGDYQLKVGADTFALAATDSFGNTSRDTVFVTRGGDVSPPSIARSAGTKDSLFANSVTSYTVSWSVTDDVKLGAVTIGGAPVTVSGGVYSKLILMTVGVHKVGIVALDSAGHASTDTVVLSRTALAPTHTATVGNYIGTVYDTLKSPGADYIEYSTDGANWTRFNGVAAIKGTGLVTVYARAQPGAVLSSVSLTMSQINSVSAGWSHSLFLKSDGTVWGSGSNSSGALGNGGQSNVSTPVKVSIGPVSSIVAGNGGSFFVKADKSVWATGANYSGNLGTGSTANALTPVQVLTDVVSVSGASATYFVKSNGSLWATGSDLFGSFGDGPTDNSDSIVRPVSGVTSVLSAWASEVGGLILKQDGSVWSAGSNQTYQLGFPSDSVYINTWAKIPGLPVIKSAVTCDQSSLFLATDGSVYGAGHSSYGLFGLTGTGYYQAPTKLSLSGISKVSLGTDHALYLAQDGTLYLAGRTVADHLGTRNGAEGPTYDTPTVLMKDVAAMSSGSGYSVILKSDGTLWAFGDNSQGQLGNGTTTDSPTPVQINF